MMWRSFVFSTCLIFLMHDAVAQPVRRSEVDVTATVVSIASSRRLTVRDSGGRVLQIDTRDGIESRIKPGDTIRVRGVTLDGKNVAAATARFIRAGTLRLPTPQQPILRSIGLSRTTACPGEEIVVTVAAQHPSGPGGWVNVMINGYPTARRILRFTGDPGPRYVRVAASTEDGHVESQSRTVTIQDCPAARFHDVRTRFNPYQPYTVDFTVVNHVPGTRSYQWDFGDGTPVVTTDGPFVSHDYAESVDDQRRYYTFETTVRDQRSATLTRNFVTVHSAEYRDLRRGLVQPRVTTSGELQPRGRRYSGSFRIENVSNEPLLFDRAFIEYQYCDPARRSTYAQTTPAEVIYHGGRDDAPPVTIVQPARPGLGPTTPPVPGVSVSPTIPPVRPATPATPPAPAIPTPPPPITPAVTTVPTTTATPTTTPRPGSGVTPVTPRNPARPTAPAVSVTIGTTPTIGPTGTVVNVPTVAIPPNQTHSGFLRVLAPTLPDGVCGIAYHLIGDTPSGADVFASLYYELRSNPHLTAAVTDARMAAFLEQLVDRGLVDESDAIGQETLYRLRQEGKVRHTASGWEIVP